MKETVKKLMRVYEISEEEAIELYEYDKNHTGSDKASREYLESKGLEPVELELMFEKNNDQSGIKKAKVIEKRKKAKDVNELIKNLVSDLEKQTVKSELFGEVNAESMAVKTFAAETGKSITIKVSRHKKPASGSANIPEEAKTPNQKRVAIIHKVAEANDLDDLKLTTTGATFSLDHPTFPHGSIKITHHKN